MRLKVFFIAFLLSLPVWLCINMAQSGTEKFLVAKEIAKNPQIYKAQPLIVKPEPQISAKSALILKNNSEVIYSKNPDQILPIASLSKIMSGYVAKGYLNLSDNLTITQSGLLDRVSDKIFVPGQVFKAKDLLYASIVESQNDGIESIANIIGPEAFLDLMNLEAKDLGLKNTKFYNPTGLDPLYEGEGTNYSTANEVAKLAHTVFGDPVLAEMFLSKEFDLYDTNGNLHHKSYTTNELIADSINFRGMTMVAGKTGKTAKAGECLVIELKNDKGDVFVGVVLGSEDRFSDMKAIVDWAISKMQIELL